jgi:HK97 family phage prohead protease
MKEKRQDESEREIRTAHITDWKVRTADNGGRSIAGHVAVFNQPTDMYFFREQIAPGAFKSAIGRDDIRATFNHNPDMVLGRNKAGTLTLSETDKGLYMDVQPPDTQWARDLIVSIERGDINQGSFAFQVLKQTWQESEDGKDTLRTIDDVKLYDVSVVTFPQYPGATVGLRSLEEWKKQKPLEPEGRRLDSKERMKLRLKEVL